MSLSVEIPAYFIFHGQFNPDARRNISLLIHTGIRSYHICKVVCTTNVLAVAVYILSKFPIMTFTYHQALCDKEPIENKKSPS